MQFRIFKRTMLTIESFSQGNNFVYFAPKTQSVVDQLAALFDGIKA